MNMDFVVEIKRVGGGRGIGKNRKKKKPVRE
jgi:hypothetical protein